MKIRKQAKAAEVGYPLSTTASIRGNRRLVREKAMQILLASEIMGCSWREVFQHIFFREFTFDSKEAADPQKLLTPAEILELEADVPIRWEDDEIFFGQHLLKIVDDFREEYDENIERIAANWQFDRIAMIDRQLLRLAFAELITCSDIPIKVTVNEFIELSKRFSTDKSNVFINGILEAAIEEMHKGEKIRKTGRGLKEE